MTDFGSINMRAPGGYASKIAVSVTAAGSVDIVVDRSSEGEALIRLRAETAKELGELLATAATLAGSPA